MDTLMNYVAILIAAAAMMGLGALWYGPLFGKAWRNLMGFTPERMKTMKMSTKKAMALQALASLITVFMLALFMSVFEPKNGLGAIVLAFLIWVGFIATTMANSVLFEDRPARLYVLNASYQLVALVLAAMIIYLVS